MSSIITPPQGQLFFLSDCIEFIGESCPEDADYTYDLIWNVCINNNDVWTETAMLPKAQGNNISIDLSELIACAVYRTCPVKNEITQHVGSSLEVVIKYGEIKKSKVGCSKEIVIDKQTEPIIVLASYCQYYENTTPSNNMLLGNYPRFKKVCPDQCDWLSMYVEPGIVIMYQYELANGSIINKVSPILSSGFISVPVGPQNLTIPLTTVKYTVTVLGQQITYIIDKCKCCEEGQLLVAFEMPKGGWSSEYFSFCDMASTIERTYNQICSITKSGQNNSLRRKIENVRQWETFEIKKEITIKETNKDYWKSFAISSYQKATVRCDNTGTLYPVFLNLSGFDFSLGKKEIVLTGYYPTDLSTFRFSSN